MCKLFTSPAILISVRQPAAKTHMEVLWFDQRLWASEIGQVLAYREWGAQTLWGTRKITVPIVLLPPVMSPAAFVHHQGKFMRTIPRTTEKTRYQDFEKVLAFLTYETTSLCQRAWQKKVWLYAHCCRREVEWDAVSKVLAIPGEWVAKRQIIFNPNITHTQWITLIHLRSFRKEAT